MTKSDAKTYNWKLLFGFWAVLAALFVFRTFYNAGTSPLLWDTDDAMRLTVVRDFIAGQNWFDHTQYRLNIPFGADIHWSRLLDLPIAGLIWLFSSFFGAQGETIVLYAWPLLLLLALLALTSRLAISLAGPDAQLPGLVLPVLSAAIMTEFSPGRIDHHSIQILLVTALLLASIRAIEKPNAAIWAGFCAATSMAIGGETLPFIAAAIVSFGLAWIVNPSAVKPMRWFGVSLAMSALVHMALAFPPADYFVAKCDAYSIVYAAAAAFAGASLALLSYLPFQSRHWTVRLSAGILTGILVLGILVGLFPQCLAGPYQGLDPWLVENWLNQIQEARPVWDSLLALPALTLGLSVPPITALAAVIVRLIRQPDEKRLQWLIYAVFVLCAVLGLVLQVRGARLAAAMAVPAGAWVILSARRVYLSRPTPLAIAGLVGAWLAFSSIPIMMLANFALPPQTSGLGSTAENKGHTEADCRMPEAFSALQTMPPQRIMAPVDMGSHLLVFTPHSVVGAPYHRNAAGVLDTFRFFNGTAEQAREIARARGITLIVTCAYLPEMNGVGEVAPDAILRDFAKGATPAWMHGISPPDGVLRLFEITP